MTGRFALLTGVGGEGRIKAAKAAKQRFGIDIAALTIGPSGCDAVNIYAGWYRASEIEEDGCILVRPDHHVAWRMKSASAKAGSELAAVLARLLAVA
jgi:2,4-dichlorophenol 6-monooxygenase